MKAGSATTSPKWRSRAKNGNAQTIPHACICVKCADARYSRSTSRPRRPVTSAPYWNQSNCSVLVPYCCMTTPGHILTVWQLRRPGTLGKYCTALKATASMVKNDKAVKNCKLFLWLTHVEGYTDIRKKYGTSWNFVTEWREKPNPCCLGRSPVSFNVIAKFLHVFLTSSAKLHVCSIVI